MIYINENTVFNVDAQTIVNTVNTTGTMGAGIALEFALRYPEMYEDYKQKCENKLITTGTVDYYHVPDGTIIINFPTKQYYAYPSKIQWIEEGLKNFVDTYKSHGVISAAFPKLGCSNGKLEWKAVKPLMIKYLDNLDIDIFICESTKSEPAGLEKIMVDEYNKFITGKSEIKIKLSEKQEDAIYNCGKIKRFYEIREIDGIKGAPYKKIFTTFYQRANITKDIDGDGQYILF